jgi:hypothetical protein
VPLNSTASLGAIAEGKAAVVDEYVNVVMILRHVDYSCVCGRSRGRKAACASPIRISVAAWCRVTLVCTPLQCTNYAPARTEPER